MVALRARNWWVFVLEGVVAIIFGVLALLWPGLTLLTLILLFGSYALVDGIFGVIAGIASSMRNQRWWAVVLRGVIGIIVGIVTFVWPGTTALALLYFIAAWAILTGIFEIVAGIQLRQLIENEWVMIVTGIASILFGLLLVLFPGAGALSLVWLIGAYAIVLGILLIILAFRLRSLSQATEPTRASPASHA